MQKWSEYEPEDPIFDLRAIAHNDQQWSAEIDRIRQQYDWQTFGEMVQRVRVGFERARSNGQEFTARTLYWALLSLARINEELYRLSEEDRDP